LIEGDRIVGYWPTADANPSTPPYEVEYAHYWQRVPKVVFSKTLRGVDWNSRLVAGSAVEEVARLKSLGRWHHGRRRVHARRISRTGGPDR
jgi:hypothetical protein